jgi:RimJ/RimL family protein N-acetyltransferase
MSASEIPRLETERLRLRGLHGTDFEDYAALYADPEVVRFISDGGPWDRGRAWRHMAFVIGHWQLRGTGLWAVEEKASGAFAGVVGFAEPATWPGFELGGHLVRRFWGRGYAIEVGRAALAHAFGALGKERIISLVHPKNETAIRAAERLGERFKDRIQLGGKEVLRYELDRTTYRGAMAPAAGAAAVRVG